MFNYDTPIDLVDSSDTHIRLIFHRKTYASCSLMISSCPSFSVHKADKSSSTPRAAFNIFLYETILSFTWKSLIALLHTHTEYTRKLL